VAEASSERFAALDGLRGWAALSVVIYHCVWETFGARFPELHNFATAFIGNGIMAVSVFLTISGYVLTRRRWRSADNPPLYVTFVRRYVRLTIPIVAATALVFVLMVLDLTPTRAAHRLTDVPLWYGSFLRFEPHILDAIGFGFALTYTWPARNYNPFLWTMMIELWGALVLFALSQGDRFQREPYTPLLFLAAITLLIFPPAACFVLGALIALAERDGALPATSTRLGSFVASSGLLALLLAGAFAQMLSRDSLAPALLGTGIFLAVRYSLPAQRFLTLPLSQFLGRISYPLYLAQFAIIVSLSAQLIIVADRDGILNSMTAVAIAATSVLASLVVATLLLPVETATLALLRRFDGRRRGPRASVAPAAIASSTEAG
jgi:peptidoglycan/LPS O-acetylase OafA/YrhL